MRRTTLLATLALALAATVGAARATGSGAHAFAFDGIDGAPLPLESFKGKAVLVVNTASLCGFTNQYAGLQAVWERYREKGLVVLGVPSNDFGGQEPGKDADIKEFCETNFAVDFPLAAKTTVSGTAAHPFYRWAGDQVGFVGRPRWNFHKYLIAPDGRLVDWFSTATAPDAPRVRAAIEAVLPK
jgi:glutathione peroxidase